MKNYNEFIKESVKIDDTHTYVFIDYAAIYSHFDIETDKGKKQITKQITKDFDKYKKKYDICLVDIDYSNMVNNYPNVSFKGKINKLYKLLVELYDDKTDALYFLVEDLMENGKELEAFNIMKKLDLDMLKDQNFSEKFLKSLSNEDINLLKSLKNVNTFNL